MPCAGRPDQANVMIFGQSAGSASVSLHTTLPASWPYFAKAGMASGEVRTARPPALPAERQRARRLSESPGGGGAAQYATWNAATWADRVAVFPDFALTAMAKELGCSLVSGDLVETCFLAASTSALLQVLITLLICCAVRGVKRWSSTFCFLAAAASALPQVLITLLICCAVRGVKRWSSTSCFLAAAAWPRCPRSRTAARRPSSSTGATPGSRTPR